MTTKANFIEHLHAFRGFAIINIVAAHCWSFMIFWTGDLSSDTIKWLFWGTETLFHGSTLYFAIISGLLFSKVLQNRGWTAFYQSKLTNVVLPYCIVTFALTAYYWTFFLQAPGVEDTATDYLSVASGNLVSGGGAIHFWYIPVLMVMFAVTPLLAWLYHKSKWAFGLIVLLPLLVSRSPFPDFLQPQSFVFFIGAYAIGIALGYRLQQTYQWVAKYFNWLALAVVATSVTIFLTYLYNYQPQGFYSLRQTLIYIQKTLICVLVLYWFAQRESLLPKWLNTLGTYAFAIFFLHVVFIDIVIQSVRELLAQDRQAIWIAAFGSMNLIAGLIGSVMIGVLAKAVLKKYARNILGV